MTPSVLHLSTYAGGGGAGRAATALHMAMIKAGVDSHLVSAHGARFEVAKRAERYLWRLQKSPVFTWRSTARFGSLTAKDIDAMPGDVVNLHWITDGFLTVEEIGKITKPVVWSLYDMWPFTGTEHYGVDSPTARWRTGYTTSNRPNDESGPDLDRWTWERKQRNWGNSTPMPFVVPASTWMTTAAHDSALMGTWPITRIPHVIDDEVFAPTSRTQAREQLKLDRNAPTIVFLASAGISDDRKGFDLLAQALPEVAVRMPGLRVAVVGPPTPSLTAVKGVPIDWVGTLKGDEALRAAYCAADVVAVPSREDNMPLTAMEAQTCGRAVVAFAIGGLTDIVEHHSTGYLAQPHQQQDLATGLIEALEDSRHANIWGQAARSRAVETWSPKVVVPKYLDLYQRALS